MHVVTSIHDVGELGCSVSSVQSRKKPNLSSVIPFSPFFITLHQTMATARPPPQYKPEVLTFVLTIEYNGFAYAGFQRQTATHHASTDADADGRADDVLSISASTTSSANVASESERSSVGATNAMDGKREATCSSSRHPPSKKSKHKQSKAPITVQQQLETALHQWTGLSIATLRVRGAGRTDKGVHACGQVVGFDVPLSLLKGEGGGGSDETTDSCDRLSEHAFPLLRGAYQSLTQHRDQPTNSDTGNANDNIQRKTYTDQWKIRRALSTRLPPDIVIRSTWIWNGDEAFEARQRISCKTYVYHLRFRSLTYCSPSTTNNDDTSQLHPICHAGPHLLRRISDQNDVWSSPWPLDPSLLPTACQLFVGVHDFGNFIHKDDRRGGSTRSKRNATDREKSHSIDLFQFTVDLQLDQYEDRSIPPIYGAKFTLKAKGFHRQMVRNLVGFVVDVARGLRLLEDIPMLLMGKAGDEKTRIGDAISSSIIDASLPSLVNAAPACGLCLAKVEYERNNFV